MKPDVEWLAHKRAADALHAAAREAAYRDHALAERLLWLSREHESQADALLHAHEPN